MFINATILGITLDVNACILQRACDHLRRWVEWPILIEIPALISIRVMT